MTDNILWKRKINVVKNNAASLLYLTEQLRDLGIDDGEVWVTVTKDKKIIIEKVGR